MRFDMHVNKKPRIERTHGFSDPDDHRSYKFTKYALDKSENATTRGQACMEWSSCNDLFRKRDYHPNPTGQTQGYKAVLNDYNYEMKGYHMQLSEKSSNARMRDTSYLNMEVAKGSKQQQNILLDINVKSLSQNKSTQMKSTYKRRNSTSVPIRKAINTGKQSTKFLEYSSPDGSNCVHGRAFERLAFENSVLQHQMNSGKQKVYKNQIHGIELDIDDFHLVSILLELKSQSRFS